VWLHRRAAVAPRRALDRPALILAR